MFLDFICDLFMSLYKILAQIPIFTYSYNHHLNQHSKLAQKLTRCSIMVSLCFLDYSLARITVKYFLVVKFVEYALWCMTDVVFFTVFARMLWIFWFVDVLQNCFYDSHYIAVNQAYIIAMLLHTRNLCFEIWKIFAVAVHSMAITIDIMSVKANSVDHVSGDFVK